MAPIKSDILIVGAGMCGLMAATTLQQDNCHITIVDKGKSVGGRLATRRMGPGLADHGAQFLTVREASFQAYVDEWMGIDLVYKWSDGWTAGSLPDGRPITKLDGYPRYAVNGGFNALAKHLVAQLEPRVNIQVNTKLISVKQIGKAWQAQDEAGQVYACDALVLTSPVPQSLALLDGGDVQLHNDDRVSLERVVYGPCLCGLFWIEGKINFPDPGAIPRPGGIVSWIADNQRKGISPDATLITVHAMPDFSRIHYDEPEEVVMPLLQETLQPYLASDVTIREAQLKRWCYAQPEVLHPERHLHAQGMPSLFFGGDAFGGPRVEGAALSGMSIGEAIE